MKPLRRIGPHLFTISAINLTKDILKITLQTKEGEFIIYETSLKRLVCTNKGIKKRLKSKLIRDFLATLRVSTINIQTDTLIGKQFIGVCSIVVNPKGFTKYTILEDIIYSEDMTSVITQGGLQFAAEQRIRLAFNATSDKQSIKVFNTFKNIPTIKHCRDTEENPFD